MPSEDRTRLRGPAIILGLIAVSLGVASALHLSGGSYDAGIPEAVIGVVLAGAATLMRRGASSARAVGMSATAFAIAGFGVGLSETAREGHVLEIAYHLVALPILIGTFLALLAAHRHQNRNRHPLSPSS